MLNNKEAIQAIKNNWPSERYQLLREALILAITALEQTDKEIREAQIRDEILFLESIGLTVTKGDSEGKYIIRF